MALALLLEVSPSASELIEVNPYGVAVYGVLVMLLVTAVAYLAKKLESSHKREAEMSAKFVDIMRESLSDRNKTEADRVIDKIADTHNDIKNTMSNNRNDLINTMQNGFNNINSKRT
jgi:hypothetical protein